MTDEGEPGLDGFDLKVLVRTLVMPPALPFLLMGVGLVLIAWRRPARVLLQPSAEGSDAPIFRRFGLRLAGIGLALSYLLSIGATADLLGAWLEKGQQQLEVEAIQTAASRAGIAVSGPPAGPSGSRPQAVVILGGGTVRDGANTPERERLKEGTLQRVIEGARLARETGLPVLVSGGIPSGLKRPEGQIMRDVLEQLGLRVKWVEDQSRDTVDNARMSAALLHDAGVRDIVLVTHAYHMPRARLAFEAAGLNVTAAAHDFLGGRWQEWRVRDFLPRASDAEAIALCLHELLGRLWYAWRGHI